MHFVELVRTCENAMLVDRFQFVFCYIVVHSSYSIQACGNSCGKQVEVTNREHAKRMGFFGGGWDVI